MLEIIKPFHQSYDIASISDALRLVVIFDGWLSFNLKTLSMTESSVDVVAIPQNAVQSFATIPAANNSLPRFTVPA